MGLRVRELRLRARSEGIVAEEMIDVAAVVAVVVRRRGRKVRRTSIKARSKGEKEGRWL